jgi:Domain of unknown function (DUF4340)
MIKKTTLLVLFCAVVLGAAVYYFQGKYDREQKAAKDTSKPAFSIQASNVASFTLAHPAQPGQPAIRFEKRNGVWQIVQPVETEADQPAAQGIVDLLAGARVSQTEPGTAGRRKAYGLDPPQVSVEFQLQNGAKHTLLIGDKDFTGASVYAIVDGAPNVSLLPESISTSTGKSLDDLRDRAVLHIDSGQVTSFVLRNAGGDLAVVREKGEWKFSKPAGVLADQDAVDSLLSAVSTAKMAGIVSEKPDNLSKYGLANPAVTFTATDAKGQKSVLLVGKKERDAYFARDPSRPMIFRIQQDLYTKLARRFSDLRDKNVVHLVADDIQRIQIRNSAGAIVLSRRKNNPDDWMIDAPAEQKGKSAASWKILDPITNLRAEAVIDHPAASLLAQLAKPAVRVVLTGKSGQEITLRISKPSGDFAYAQTSGSPALYKLKKQAVDDLNLKPADLIP